MPIPKPRDNEERDAFVSRCMGDEVMNRDYRENDQRAAVCYNAWREAQREKAMGVNDLLLSAVKARGRKLERFGRGILTADRYVSTLLDVFGWDSCYKMASHGNLSFHDILTKAADTLVWSSDDMVVEEKAAKLQLPDGVELPKNTLMAFRHVLTTSRKDRDGDVMHSDGAELDPKMLLLWQHVPTMPIGKMLASVEQNKNRVVVVSAIVDINDLCHDAAVMVDNGMGRFSHGFRALDFSEIKAGREGDGKQEPGGFDVKKFEIMEESLVSVPANVDADTEEVLLSLVEGGKLTSGVMKEQARFIREKRPTTVPVKLDLKVTVNGREVQNDENVRGAGEGTEERDKAGTPGEAGGGAEQEAEVSEDTKVSEEMETKAEQVKLNAGGAGQAKRLIAAGKVKSSGAWSGPSADTGNKYLEANGAASYGKWFLGVRPGMDAENKGAYAYPYTADFETVDRAGLVAIRQRAGQQKEMDIFEAAGAMVEAIDKAKKDEELTGIKQGRVLSKANETKIRDARDDISDASKMEGVSRPCKALLQRAGRTLGEVLSSLGEEPAGEGKPAATEKTEVGIADAVDVVLNRMTAEQRSRLSKTLVMLENREIKSKRYRAIRHGKVRRDGPGGHKV